LAQLYCGADEALFLLGTIHEKQADTLRNSQAPEHVKERFAGEAHKKAIEAYSRIITRYPVTDRAADARERLTALGLPVPTPTPEAIAQNQAEEASRGELGKMGTIMLNFRKRPDVAAATKVGEPTMVEPKQTSATDVVRQNAQLLGGAQPAAGGGTAEVSAETAGSGAQPGANQPVPRSDETPAPPPQQVNEVDQPQGQQAAQPSAATQAEEKDDKDEKDSKDDSSSSKKKKKKGLRKIVPW
jgi:outer membrane protein assembly factor BamD